MENQEENPDRVETNEEFPDEFQCCVCLDLLYKPVVLACGHISCFWCVFNAMDSWQVSHCPICRHPYNHFPSICQLLHFLLLKLYRVAYKRREQQVIEEEKRSEQFSLQLDNCVRSHPSKWLNINSVVSPRSTASSCNTVILGSCSKVEGEPSVIKGSDSSILSQKEDKLSIPAESDFEATEKEASQKNDMLGDTLNLQQNSEQLLMADFLCYICKELLYRPVVLNCGHVYCEVCITSPSDRLPRCQVCQSEHPNGCPKVCLVLEHFLEEQFSDQYASRKEAVCKQANSQNGSTPACSTQSPKNAAQLLSISTNAYRSWLSGRESKVHSGVGCDYCGMCPIIGERYRCKDCKEKIGFDLCEGCYNSSSKLPGRFNQQHTSDHELENVQATVFPAFVSRLETEEYESDSPDDIGGYSDFQHVPGEDSDDSVSGLEAEDYESIIPTYLFSDFQHVPGEGSASSIYSDDNLGEQEG